VPAVPELRQPSAKAPEPVPLAIATPAPVAKTPEAAPPERLSLVTINPALRRLDVIAPPSPPPRVAIAEQAKDRDKGGRSR
jgi:hypothetical protein